MAGRSEPRLLVYGCRPYDEQAEFRRLRDQYGMEIQWLPDHANLQNADAAKGFDAVSVLSFPLPGEVVRALGQAGVRMISTRTIGYDHIDLEAARQAGMRVSNASYSPESVAEYTVMLMLMSLRHMKRIMERGNIHDFSLPGTIGRQLGSCTVGVLGAGNIGKAVIRMLSGFGCKILACARHPAEIRGAEFVSLNRILAESDILTLHMPLTEDNYHILDRAAFENVKPGAVIVNTARGGLIDTEALIENLESGRLGGAALDVVEGESGLYHFDRKSERLCCRNISILKDMPNVVFSHHMAFYTREAVAEMAECSVKSCLLELTGQENPWRIL